MARVQVRGGLGPGPDGVVRDLDVAEGELFALSGQWDGRGRSLLRRIAGLEPSKAEIIFDEKKMNDVAPEGREVSLVFASGALFDHLTVHDNLAFGLKARGTATAETEERVLEAARAMSIEHLLQKALPRLSAEERVRVAVARGLTRRPAVLLLDDPFSTLDAAARRAIRNDLARAVRKLRLTTLFSTSDVSDALAIGHRVALYRNGVCRQVGLPLDLYERPADRHVAAVVGSTPMNLVKLRVEKGRVGVGGMSLAAPGEGEIYLGVRAEALVLEESPYASVPLRATVDLCEIDGASARVMLLLNDQRVTMICEARRAPAEGADITVYTDPERLKLFSASEDGVAVDWTFNDIDEIPAPVFEKTMLDPQEIAALAQVREETPVITGVELTPSPLLEPREVTPIIEGQELTMSPPARPGGKSNHGQEQKRQDEAFGRVDRKSMPGEGALTQTGSPMMKPSAAAGDSLRPAVEATVPSPPLVTENADSSHTTVAARDKEASQESVASGAPGDAATKPAGPAKPEAA